MKNNISFDHNDELCITSLRILAVDMVEKAKSGHPGLPLGVAPTLYVLWSRFLKHSPKNPLWYNRDRFVLSAGHGSALLYSLLHHFGYGLPIEDLKQFRQWGSKTPGHPEYGHTVGVETTTGPLGQGVANAVGMALAEKMLAAQFNLNGQNIVDHYTYVLAGDGDMMEGVAHEAVSFAGQNKLHKLICLYDDNSITIEGKTSLAFSEDVPARFRACGWNTLAVADGNNPAMLAAAIAQAKTFTNAPTLIAIKNHIGYGSPKQDTEKVHGEPLGTEGMAATRKFYNWTAQPFEIPAQVREHFAKIQTELAAYEAQWNKEFDGIKKAAPALAQAFEDQMSGKLPHGIEEKLPSFDPAKPVATRQASGTVINYFADNIPAFVGGSADLAPSNKTAFANRKDKMLHFGIREHGMAGIVNGLALHGGLIPFGATFFVFSDYLRPSARLAALMSTQSIFVLTHDSIGVGEDGPTHQPVEHLAAMRLIPNLLVLRPADANETADCWMLAIKHKGPSCLVLTRQSLPILPVDRAAMREGVNRGAYIAYEPAKKPEAVILATGSEVHISLEAAKLLAADGISARVLSIPSMELFEKQGAEYISSLLPENITNRVAVEAGSSMCWHKWLGGKGSTVCIDGRFGASAPDKVNFEKYGFTPANIAAAVKRGAGK